MFSDTGLYSNRPTIDSITTPERHAVHYMHRELSTFAMGVVHSKSSEHTPNWDILIGGGVYTLVGVALFFYRCIRVA